jgi:hypothetical protein
MMRKIIKKIGFVSLFAFIVFALVSSHGIVNHQLEATAQKPINCVESGRPSILPSLNQPCLNNSSNNSGTALPPLPPLPSSPSLPTKNDGNQGTPNPNINPSTNPSINPTLNPKDNFLAAVTDRLTVVPQDGSYEYILLRSYGAPFVTELTNVHLPQKVVLSSDQETKAYQATLTMGQVNGGSNCILQKVAADAFNAAKAEVNIPLKSGYGNSDCTRDFATNLRFWKKYADNNTLERVRQGREKRILGIVAPPGASQHLWGLALDLGVSSSRQRQALYKYGWFQTVENDRPHWTYVGIKEEDLSRYGFQRKVAGGVIYWLTPL